MLRLRNPGINSKATVEIETLRKKKRNRNFLADMDRQIQKCIWKLKECRKTKKPKSLKRRTKLGDSHFLNSQLATKI